MSDVIPRFGFRVRVGAACQRGIRREHLEDAYLSAPELGVFAIADGMGGHQAGEIAAEVAIDEIRTAMASDTTHKIATLYFERPELDSRRRAFERLRRIVERAHARVRRTAAERGEVGEIGTTLDLVWLVREEALIAHVGDSRIYIARPNAVLQVTEDHIGPASTETSRSDSLTQRAQPTRLVRAIGIGETASADTLRLELKRGDRLVLVTDGVWSSLNDEAELGRIAAQGDADRAALSLVERAKARSFDDRTALVLEIGERFVRHSTKDDDAMARDLAPVAESALFSGLSWPKILATLSIGVHVDFDRGQVIPHRATGDRVAYVVLEGLVRTPEGRQLGRGATLFAECLVGCEPVGGPPLCEEPVRAVRIRRDDFGELCCSDVALAADLYKRLASHLGTRLGR